MPGHIHDDGGAWIAIHCFQAHLLHQVPYFVPAYGIAHILQACRHPSGAAGRVFQIQFVQVPHKLQLQRRCLGRVVVKGTAIDTEDITLMADAESPPLRSTSSLRSFNAIMAAFF